MNSKERARALVAESDTRWHDFRDSLLKSLALKNVLTQSTINELLDAARVASEEFAIRTAAIATMQEASRAEAEAARERSYTPEPPYNRMGL